MTAERMKILDCIIADLKGTCQNIDDVAEYWNAGELAIDDLEYIEREVFLCNECGWWCETFEMTGDHVCSDCTEEGEEEE